MSLLANPVMWISIMRLSSACHSLKIPQVFLRVTRKSKTYIYLSFPKVKLGPTMKNYYLISGQLQKNKLPQWFVYLSESLLSSVWKRSVFVHVCANSRSVNTITADEYFACKIKKSCTRYTPSTSACVMAWQSRH